MMRSIKLCEAALDWDQYPIIHLKSGDEDASFTVSEDWEVEEVMQFFGLDPSGEEIEECLATVREYQPRSTLNDVIEACDLDREATWLTVEWLHVTEQLEHLDINGTRVWITPDQHPDGQSED